VQANRRFVECEFHHAVHPQSILRDALAGFDANAKAFEVRDISWAASIAGCTFENAERPMTPGEARQLARLLMAAANEIEELK
jgi:hypothetical protein